MPDWGSLHELRSAQPPPDFQEALARLLRVTFRWTTTARSFVRADSRFRGPLDGRYRTRARRLLRRRWRRGRFAGPWDRRWENTGAPAFHSPAPPAGRPRCRDR